MESDAVIGRRRCCSVNLKKIRDEDSTFNRRPPFVPDKMRDAPQAAAGAAAEDAEQLRRACLHARGSFRKEAGRIGSISEVKIGKKEGRERGGRWRGKEGFASRRGREGGTDLWCCREFSLFLEFATQLCVLGKRCGNGNCKFM